MAPKLQLPPLVVGPADVGRLLRELENIDEALLQLKLRQPGSGVKMPKTSQLMDKLAELNKLNLLEAADRQQLIQFLTAVRTKAPVMHMSFGADPPVNFVEKLIEWIRQEIHPQALVTVGLQPNIGAGCMLRTTNHHFDFSLRQDFLNKRELLLQQLRLPATPQESQA